ncbi:hypothetical protein Bca101_038984 [Brassica carinata]
MSNLEEQGELNLQRHMDMGVTVITSPRSRNCITNSKSVRIWSAIGGESMPCIRTSHLVRLSHRVQQKLARKVLEAKRSHVKSAVAGIRTRDDGHLSRGSFTTRPRGPVCMYASIFERSIKLYKSASSRRNDKIRREIQTKSASS